MASRIAWVLGRPRWISLCAFSTVVAPGHAVACYLATY